MKLITIGSNGPKKKKNKREQLQGGAKLLLGPRQELLSIICLDT